MTDAQSTSSGSRTALLLGLLGLIALVVFLLWPLRHSGWWPFTHELDRYQLLVKLHLDAAAEGQLYPRWLPEMTGGYGYPLFVYYQPGFFLLALPFGLAGASAGFSVCAAVCVLFVLGASGAFLLGRICAGRNSAGVFTAALFLLTPYLYVNLYVRGDLSELMAMLLTPWPIVGLLMLQRRNIQKQTLWPGILIIAVGMAAVVLAHPITAFFYMPVLMVFAVVLTSEVPSAERKRFAWEAAGALLMAVALSSFYWLPVLTMGSASKMEEVVAGNDYYNAERHVVGFQQLVSRYWGHGIAKPDSTADTMSFQLGLPHLLLAVGGVWIGRRRRFLAGAGILYILLVLLMTPLAAWAWRLPFLEMVHFPWRLLSVIAILQAIGAAGWFTEDGRRPAWLTLERLQFIGPLVLLAAILWQPAICGVPGYISVQEQVLDSSALRCREAAGVRAKDKRYLQELETFKHLVLRTPEELTSRPLNLPAIEQNARRLASTTTWGFHNADKGEWLPRTAQPAKLHGPRRKWVLVPKGGTTEDLPGHSPYRIRQTVSTPPTGPHEALINQLYFPGWRVFLNGREVTASELERHVLPDGRMRLKLPAAICELEAWYDGPPHGGLRLALMVFVVGGWLVLRYFLFLNSSKTP